MRPLFLDSIREGEKDWWKPYRMSNIKESDLVRSEVWSFQLRLWVEDYEETAYQEKEIEFYAYGNCSVLTTEDVESYVML